MPIAPSSYAQTFPIRDCVRHTLDYLFQHFAKEMESAVASDTQEARQETPSPILRQQSPPSRDLSEISPRAVPETIRVPVATLGKY